MIRDYIEQVKKNHDQLVKPYPFVKEGLTILHNLGYQMGIVTNKERQLAEMGVALAGIHDLLQVVICIEDVKKGKPAAEPIFKAISNRVCCVLKRFTWKK
ncbi:HAD hydrolase-like protein [Aneurinibacillus terranovensis]|uniref:HAD hydrolase-like protein n=1 Tax=Aneurinibacillus terranovensis TaxID=278991 RepID=UPI0003FC8BD2|nr:HAD hydrolase-like protein [Aneurinibacillus terranovensis]